MARAPLAPARSADSESPARPDKRALILEAAIEVFAERGYHGSRISDIASRAGIAYGLVYHYFKNKEEILATIFEERWEGFLEVLDAIAAAPTSTEDKLVSVAALILNAYRVRPDWVKVLVFEILRSSRFSEPGQLRALGRLFEAMAGILRTGQERGELRKDLDPRVACYVLIGALDTVITSRVLGVKDGMDASGDANSALPAGEEDERAFHLKVAKTVVEIFLHGIGNPGEGQR